jgi:hypothetical protein
MPMHAALLARVRVVLTHARSGEDSPRVVVLVFA